jgi:hypothetical protein
MFAAVTNGLATDKRRAVACTGPEMPRQQFRAEIVAPSEPSTRLTPVAAFLELRRSPSRMASAMTCHRSLPGGRRNCPSTCDA